MLEKDAEAMSDTQWLQYLQESETLGAADFVAAVEQVQSSLQPVQEAIQDRQASTSKLEI